MENQVNAMPRIGDSAPEFQAVTTQGKINFPNDFSGKWKILFEASRDERNLYLTITETGEKLTLRNWYYYRADPLAGEPPGRGAARACLRRRSSRSFAGSPRTMRFPGRFTCRWT